MPAHYTVSGPYLLPTVTNSKRTKRIADHVKKDFAETEFAHGRGCYIFALRKGRGIIPYYVGKTSRSFLSECFTDHKLQKYNATLHAKSWGKPLLFFVQPVATRGPLNGKALSALEEYLIGLGFQCNDDLRNIHGKTSIEPLFAIEGVHTPRRGKPPGELTMFRKMLGVAKKRG